MPPLLSRTALIVIALLPASAAALPPNELNRFLAECNARLAPSKIEVRTTPVSWVQSDRASVKELTAKSSTANRSAGFSTLGLATSQFSMSSQWGTNWMIHSSGQYSCTRPHLTVELSAGTQLVEIASEFAGNPCVRRHILEHELRHVHANQRQLESTARMLRAEMQNAMGVELFHGDHRTLRTQMEHSLATEWTVLAQEHFKQVNSAHSQIDAPAEYARNNVVCDGAVAKVLYGFSNPRRKR